jgi:hypothetical protein
VPRVLKSAWWPISIFLASAATGAPVMTAIGTPIITGTATLFSPCSLITQAAGTTISCSRPVQLGVVSADAQFSGDFLSLSSTADAINPGGPGSTLADASVTASYDQWFVITGGSGSDTLTSFMGGGGFKATISVNQGGVASFGAGPFHISSPFDYGVPFEIIATVTAIADADLSGDAWHSVGDWNVFGFSVGGAQIAALPDPPADAPEPRAQIAAPPDPPAAVPEPGSWVLVLSGVLLVSLKSSCKK